MTKDEANARDEIRHIVRESIGTRKKVVIPKLVDNITSRLQDDSAFLRRFASDQLRTAVYHIALQVLSDTRITTHSDRSTELDKLEAVAPSVWGRWEGHYEHVGNVHIKLLELTRDTGKVAIANRRAQAASYERVAVLIERLIEPLRGKRCIRDHWNVGQLNKIASELFGDPEQAA